MLEKLCGMLYQNHVFLINSCGLIISASWVLAFNLFLARLFSFIVVVFNSFMHAYVLQPNKSLVKLIHVVLGLYLILRSEFSNLACLETLQAKRN